MDLNQFTLENYCGPQGLVAGVALAQGVKVEDTSTEFRDLLDELIRTRAETEFPSQELKDAVRNMLRTAHYKPTGRGKPASEYLAQVAREGKFPIVNNLVDINNYLSLLSGLPISLLDLEVVGAQGLLRQGNAEEKYVFNSSGQEIELHGLACLCSSRGPESIPVGNAVKDSMLGKIKSNATAVVGIIYAPTQVINAEKLTEYLQTFTQLLVRFGRASNTRHLVCN